MPAAWSAFERTTLTDALRDAGPGAPTLCEGWQTEHLAAHIVLRDRRPWAMSSLQGLAEQAGTAEGYEALLAQVAEGPGRLAPGHWAGEQMNLVEFFVHTEDVRRAQPGAGPAVRLSPAHTAALWRQVKTFSRLLLRRAPTGVVLVVDDGPRVHARRSRSGAGTVIVSGTIEDLILFAFGRGAHTDVALTGADPDVDALVARFPAPLR